MSALEQDFDGGVKEGCTFSPEFPVIDGIRFLPYCTREFLDSIADLPVSEEDVFVATYPKSGTFCETPAIENFNILFENVNHSLWLSGMQPGTTWVSEILWQIYHEGKIDTTQIRLRVPFVEEFEWLKAKSANVKSTKFKGSLANFYRQHPRPKIFKTHLPHRLVPKGEGSSPKPKYIYVIRNPKDSAVSYYHHIRRFTFYNFNGDWDDYFKLWIEGKVESGLWIDHVLGWWAHRDDPNILFLKYEDMKKNLEKAVRQIAEFVGKELSEEMIKKITNQTNFDAMKNGEQFYQEKNSKVLVEGETKFIRKGVVGDWRNYFTDEQNRQFDVEFAEKMAGSGLEVEF